ncbi:dihydrofolate reductase [Mobiluncus mulieris]|uniref:dihydrofolate reductase n=1 Tax=Mobiluncus mulieris TaxID=2052 RepID=UPI000B66C9D4|nr:dihydrofolate reductase [Mobiluncus mulieris]PNL43487.1 dihydrofolate reductase [Mobiluncus mulieris]
MSQYSKNRKGTGLAPHAATNPATNVTDRNHPGGENPSRNGSSGAPRPAVSRAGHDIGLLGMIWAQDHKRILGANGGMLWRIPADFQFFKRTTLGWPVIMGRTSFEALGRPLPGRRNIILTRRPDALKPSLRTGGIEIAASVSAALELCAGTEQVWITGGGRVYQEVMDAGIADLLVVSQLDLIAPVPPDAKVTVAPVIDPQRWQLDESRSDATWRPVSGDGAWRVQYYVPR